MVSLIVVRTWIEPVVAGAQLAGSLYDTGLLMVVKNYYNSSAEGAGEVAQQKAISNFYTIYNLVLGLSPLLSAYFLARLGDEKHRKIPICGPLCGYLLSRLIVLFVILLDWPIEVIYGSAALNGLSGGFATYWSGIMALAALGSSESRRSLRLIIIELSYGVAGFIGSLASGHIFTLNLTYRQGSTLISFSAALYLLCILYSLCVLKVPQAGQLSHANKEPNGVKGEPSKNSTSEPQAAEGTRLLGARVAGNSGSEVALTPSKVILALLFTSAVLYELAVAGAIVDVLQLFVLKEPLKWDAVMIGYGNASGYVIFITSFLGIYALSRHLRDTTMIALGMLSFSAGILIMAFARWTYLYFVARAVMLFTLIPLPTIRSTISKRVQESSYVLWPTRNLTGRATAQFPHDHMKYHDGQL
uniref:Thymic stromal cotransporter homolog isoform X2 n=1 Tax=Geotrypetes seraphini TaxID=260995 RepID=A0A6P8NZ61_GEOSA|nr:thymic stromal cotransporter homolog isoform X2 [Geotrypetes seraphini]